MGGFQKKQRSPRGRAGGRTLPKTQAFLLFFIVGDSRNPGGDRCHVFFKNLMGLFNKFTVGVAQNPHIHRSGYRAGTVPGREGDKMNVWSINVACRASLQLMFGALICGLAQAAEPSVASSPHTRECVAPADLAPDPTISADANLHPEQAVSDWIAIEVPVGREFSDGVHAFLPVGYNWREGRFDFPDGRLETASGRRGCAEPANPPVPAKIETE